MTALRIGLVGCGRLAELGYVPALGLTSSVELVAVADPDPDRRALVAGLACDHGTSSVSQHPGAEALLASDAVDAVVLASPAATHVADATAAAAAGVATLVEKPPAPDAAGAATLASLDRPPWVAFNRRFAPWAAAVRRAVPSRGQIDLRLEIHYRRASWAAVDVRDDAVADLGPHLVDWARWLTGSEVVEVRAVSLATDRAELDLVLGRGRAHLRAAADRPHRERIEVRDASDTVVARHRVGGLLAGLRGRLRSGPHPLVTSLAGQLDAFAQAARDQPAPHLGTAVDGVAAMAAVDAARSSAAAGGAPIVVNPER